MIFVVGFLVFFMIIVVANSVKIVPQKQAWIVERLGKYFSTLDAGLHVIIPFIDHVNRRCSLKEVALDIPPQQCVTKDNIIVEVDGLLYLQVVDPVKATYGISDYLFACSQLAQTTLRSEIGKLVLDRTFEERTTINVAICSELDKASDPWGVKVTRYEIKTIKPPASVLDAMEKQMRAEREKRALIAESEGERQARINRADGERQEAIAHSEGEKQKRVNEAQGRAEEIRLVAQATADGLRSIANAIGGENGSEAVNLKLAEQYITEFGKLAKAGNTLVLPANLADIASLIKAAKTFVKEEK